eukprot:scaffold75_cov165-Amphora_coffeaeformis.AAC.3
MQSSLKQQDTSEISDVVRTAKPVFELKILSHQEKLKLVKQFGGEGRIDALELAGGLWEVVGEGDDFNDIVQLAVQGITRLDTDGDGMLDIDEYRTCVQDFAKEVGACPLMLLAIYSR